MFRNGWNSPGDSKSPGEFQPLRNMSKFELLETISPFSSDNNTHFSDDQTFHSDNPSGSCKSQVPYLLHKMNGTKVVFLPRVFTYQ